MAQPAAGSDVLTMSLEQCLQYASSNSLVMRAADRRIDRARALQGTAWDIDRTELSLSQDPTSGGSPDNALALSQQIEFPTVYASRRRQLKAETRVQENSRSVASQQLRADIASAYWQLVYCQERVRLLMASDTLLSRYVSVAEARYTTGEARRLEWLSATRQQRANAMLLAEARAECDVACAQLALLVGTGGRITPADTTLQPLPYTPSGYAYGGTPEGELAQSRVVAADRAIGVARSGYAPSLSLTLKNQLVITGWDPYHENRSRYAGGNFMGVEVGIGIPLFYGATRARVRSARADRDIAIIDMQRQQSERQTDYQVALRRYASASERMAYYCGQGAASADEMVRLGEIEYANGEISYMEYVSAMQEASDTRLSRASAINDYNQAVVALQRLEGK